MKKIFMLSICIMCIILSGNVNIVGQVDGYEYIYDGENNEIFQVDVRSNGDIFFYGVHAKSKATIGYHTVAFNIALKNSNRDISKLQTERILRSNDINPLPNKNQNYNMDTYKLSSYNVVKSLQSLMRAKKDSSGKPVYKDGKAILTALSKGVTVYFSNEFEVINSKTGKRIGNRTYKTWNDMKNAAAWSKRTQQILPYYYDNPLKVVLTGYTYDVVYMDQEEYKKNGTKGKILKIAEKDQPSVFAAEIEYEFKDRDHLRFNGVEYEYDSSEYCYENGLKNVSKRPQLIDGVITTEHGRTQNAVLYVLLKKKEEAKPELKPDETETNPVVEGGINPNVSAVIGSNEFGEEIYEAEKAIPATELLYAMVRADQYLLKVDYQIKRGNYSIPLTVEKTYRVKQRNGSIKENVVTQSGVVQQPYEYTEIAKIAYYKMKEAQLHNDALPDGEITLEPTMDDIPQLSYHHETSVSWHLNAPEINSVVTLPPEEVTQLPSENLIKQAEMSIESIKVRSDSLRFGSQVILSSGWKSNNGDSAHMNRIDSELAHNQKDLYQSGLIIPSETKNQMYSSEGEITYESQVLFQSDLPSELVFPIEEIAPVTVHTPVVCHAVVYDDNHSFVQLKSPWIGAYPTIVDKQGILNDFSVVISNEGFHSDYKGYGVRDYGKYVRYQYGSYENEIRFPVAVYMDIGNDFNKSNDSLLSATQWYRISKGKQRFYLPESTQEGVHHIEVRSIACNAAGNEEYTQEYYNGSSENYTATDDFEVEFSGRLYGLNLYNINDYPRWERVFKESNSLSLKKMKPELYHTGVNQSSYFANAVYNYTVGTRNSYGKDTGRLPKYTLPLTSKSHPQFTNQGRLKTGYTTYFSLATNGLTMDEKEAKVVVTPRFYYVDSLGNNREEVSIYYKAVVNGRIIPYIEVGGALDRKNIKKFSLSDPNLGIPQSLFTESAKKEGITEQQYKDLTVPVYTYGGITPIKMYGAGLAQYYYFAYSLPAKPFVVKKDCDLFAYMQKKGLTGNEDIFKKDGYLIVNFDIKAYDKDGVVRYSYQNQDNYKDYHQCCMWVTEGMQTKKMEGMKTEFSFHVGDVVLYSLSESRADDYTSEGLY